jgi:hypothetical protein
MKQYIICNQDTHMRNTTVYLEYVSLVLTEKLILRRSQYRKHCCSELNSSCSGQFNAAPVLPCLIIQMDSHSAMQRASQDDRTH